MDANVSVVTAFAAGILSFLSPCVLPLLSTYLVFISGVTRKRVVGNTLWFILGFSTVFVVMSVLLYGLFLMMSGLKGILNIAAGSLVIILGANTLCNFLPFLRYSTEEVCDTCTPEHSLLAAKETSLLHPARRPKGFLGSFLVGLAFGAGWTPCVGTMLGSILLMASQSDTLVRSVVYLVVYSAGLGVPFLVAAFCWGTLMDRVAKIKRAMPVIRVVSGLFLIAVGLVMLTGRMFLLNAFLQRI